MLSLDIMSLQKYKLLSKEHPHYATLLLKKVPSSAAFRMVFVLQLNIQVPVKCDNFIATNLILKDICTCGRARHSIFNVIPLL